LIWTDFKSKENAELLLFLQEKPKNERWKREGVIQVCTFNE